MINAVRSELLRTRRKGVILGWFGLTILFTIMINMVMAQVVGSSETPPDGGPGVTFPTLGQWQAADGITAGLSSAASMYGVVALSFWAIVTAGDYSSGLIRLTASAQPDRVRLLLGKVGALTLWTAAVATVALVVNLGVAPAAARSADLDVSAWGQDALPTLAGAWFNLFVTLFVWGVIGLVLALVTRSAAISISVGVGYVLVVEAVITAALDTIADWTPGATLSALAHGGTSSIPYGTALALGALYTLLGLSVALTVFKRRDITD
ncbi:hypothetical protein ACFFMN_01800 [Planobispora siamensis]|uniref:ABC transporter permease n=1 Tax=Planobispora siamensis TaxID=936338 RepID=A0A8J3SJQ6_9ACTN|nr:hypothetical protein [Planobispora siamensis]GIH95756.1 hypothetical protein Psi01_63860 [Planobispora siamensis]